MKTVSYRTEELVDILRALYAARMGFQHNSPQTEVDVGFVAALAAMALAIGITPDSVARWEPENKT